MDRSLYEHFYSLEERHWWFRGRRSVLWALLAQAGVHDAPRLLDAGCGTGRNLVEFSGLGAAEGVDPSPEAVEFCHERGLDRVREAGLEELPFEDGRFDLVLATDVLEHVEDDRAALAELLRITSPGGALLITVPAYMWLWSQHDESHHHFRRYTEEKLLDPVLATGWRPTVTTYFNSFLLPPIGLVRLVGRRGSPDSEGRTDYELASGPLNSILESGMRTEAQLIRRGMRFRAGVSVGMVCRPAASNGHLRRKTS